MRFAIPSLAELRQVRREYRASHGRYPSLIFSRRYSEFLQRRKLFDRDPLYTTLCDKLAVRDIVRARVGEQYLVPLLWTGTDPEQIPFDTLSYPIIIKPRHLSGFVRILRELPNADQRAELRSHFRKQMAKNHGRLMMEPGYFDIPAGILVELLLTEPDGSIPNDYKVMVFHGRAVMLQVHFSRFVQHEVGFFDLNWNRLPYTRKFPGPSRDHPAPPNLANMIGLAESLTQKHPFLRVDFYDSGGKVYVGEITVYPGSGLDAYAPADLDRRLGDFWRRRRNASLV